MEKGNICTFVPWHNEVRSVRVMNLIYETLPQPKKPPRVDGLYKVHIVFSGSGRVHTTGRVDELRAGDVFFSFPASPFSIESVGDMTYGYISFMGAKGNMILERLGIDPSHFIFEGCEEIFPLWHSAFSAKDEVMDIISESVLLYTFAAIGDRILVPSGGQRSSGGVADKIKKYIEDNYFDPSLSLEKVSEALCYHPKYVSHIFKKEMKVGFSQYLSAIRICHAATMLEQGFTAISDISAMCGFSDPQYFSKVFKTRMGMPPGRYMKLRTE